MSIRRELFLMRGFIIAVAVFLSFLFIIGTNNVYAALCGDGIKEGAEECDNGQNNSDSKPNACRTDCTLHRCGDGVKDSAEECDEGHGSNNDQIPGRCRRNCKAAKCGDGFLDFTEGETCDDGNSNGSDGCHNCYPCYLPKDNLVVSVNQGETLELCQGSYEFTDEGQEGIIIVNGYGGTLDCKGAVLIGLPPVSISAVQPMSAPAANKILQQGIKSVRSKFGKRGKSASPEEESSQSSPGNAAPQLPRSAMGYQGTGIVVNGQDIVLMNCNVAEFKQGIKINSTGTALVNNRFCDNQSDIKSESNQNYGVKNSCVMHQNWQENGQAGCMSGCN